LFEVLPMVGLLFGSDHALNHQHSKVPTGRRNTE
jgi:hypothetical protein